MSGSGSTADVTLSATSLTFTTANWNTPQTVTVTAADDAVVEVQETVTLVLAIDDAASAATEYEALNGGDGDAAVADVTVIIPASDGAVGVTVSQTAVTAVEGGSAGTFTVVLSKVPSNLSLIHI